MRKKVPSKAIGVIGVCVGAAALYFAQEFLKPLALAFLICFVLAPSSGWLERRLRFTRTLSVLTVVISAAMVIGVMGWVIGTQVTALASELPRYRETISHKLTSINGFADRMLARATTMSREIRTVTTQPVQAGTQLPATAAAPAAATQPASLPSGSALLASAPADDRDSPIGSTAWKRLTGFFSPILSLLGTALLITVFVVFMLMQREDLRDRGIRLLSRGNIGLTTLALDDAASRISHYLRMLCAVNVSYGIVLSTGFFFIGIPAAVLWGVMCCLLRFVPYVGPLISAVFPITLAVATGEGWAMLVWTLVLFGVIELITANFIEPLIYGKRTGVSPMAVIISAAFWGWLWGIEGLLMATPLTLCLAVAGKHVKRLSFLSTLLGDEPALPAHLRYYQRLVADDAPGAMTMLVRAGEQAGIIGAYEEMALPALLIAERDTRRGWVDQAHFHTMMKTLHQQVQSVGERGRSEAIVNLARGTVPEPAAPAIASTVNSPIPLSVHKTLTGARDTFRKRLSEMRQSRSAWRRGHRIGHSSLVSTYPAIPSLPRDCHPRIVVIPARDRPDELAGLMLSQILSLAGYDAVLLSTDSLAAEMVTEVRSQKPDLIIVSGTPPLAVAPTRYFLKRLAQAEENNPIPANPNPQKSL